METVQIAIADDHKLFREGVRNLLNQEQNMDCIWEAANAGEVKKKLEELPVDLLLLDINMPGTSGLELLPKLKDNHPDLKVIILSMYETDKYIYAAIKAGADSYLTKDTDPVELISVIRIVVREGVYFNAKTARVVSTALARPETATNLPKLSELELQILQLICTGQTNAEIAGVVFRATRTVEGYRQRLLEKTGTRNTAELVAFALRNKLAE
ncbi:MAG: response regulator transcription factor [Bacteroidetes bacterium]|nr:response regulator transcription factor [Bacteroidota bacterium]